MKILPLLLAAFALLGASKKESPTELNLSAIDGTKTHLKDYRGRIVVVNFWATWCGPCREEMPMIVEASKEWTSKGVVFIGASLDEKKTQSAIPEFVSKYRVEYPVWTGATLNDMARLHLGQGVPDTVFIDEEGAIFARVKGEIRRNELDERLQWATSGKKDPAPAAVLDHMK